MTPGWSYVSFGAVACPNEKQVYIIIYIYVHIYIFIYIYIYIFAVHTDKL